MKTPLLLLILACTPAKCQLAQRNEVPLSTVPRRNIVPMEVKARAQAAVKKVMDETIRGNYQAAIDTMNPEFVKVLSRPFGGPERYKAGLLKQMQDMGKNGVVFNAAITRPADIAFEVDYSAKAGEGGAGGYQQWMVFVPTVKDFQLLDTSKEPAKLRKFRKFSFEIAISPKGQEKWTFIGGDSMNSMQLRKVFPFLPADDKKLQFPEVRLEELPMPKK